MLHQILAPLRPSCNLLMVSRQVLLEVLLLSSALLAIVLAPPCLQAAFKLGEQVVTLRCVVSMEPD